LELRVINVVKEQKGQALHVRLAGSIEESVNFDQLIGIPPAELVVNCKEVPRINSVGVKAWIKYFQGVQARGTKLKFVECSTAIVEQINLISNFSVGGAVESIYVPFSCTHCKSELVGLFKTEDLKRLNLQLPELKCSKCGGKAVFDDIPEEYFGFLMR
jgi:anti-anti-sigma regulatory factor/DNA-directed RNA polymerase subunit RPC12/RpoP